jgi:hypothetical protein
VKTAAERSIEALTWAAVVIWLGFALVAHILNYVWLVVMMLGIILLSSAIYQRSRGWHTSLSLWIFGIWMAVFSVIETVSAMVGAVSDGEGLGIDLWVYLGIALVSMGVAVVFRTVQGPSLAADPRAPSRRQDDPGLTQSRRSYAPRRVEQDYSSGYAPAPQDRAEYGTGRGRSSRRGREYDQPLPTEPRDDAQYTQRSRRGEYGSEPPAPRDDVQYTQRSRRAEYQPPPQQEAPPPPERQRPSRQRRARPTEEPSNLESRVEDIIRRSRERRGGEESSGDDLPY